MTISDSERDPERCIPLFWVPEHCWFTGEGTYGIERNKVRRFFSPIRRLLALNKLHSLLTIVFNGKSNERVYGNETFFSVWKFVTANLIPILIYLMMILLCCIMKLLKISYDSKRPHSIKEWKKKQNTTFLIKMLGSSLFLRIFLREMAVWFKKQRKFEYIKQWATGVGVANFTDKYIYIVYA